MRFRFVKNIGLLLLAIWLIAVGLEAFVHLGNLSQLTSALAIVAGIFILIGR
jgi:hypothetical protein